MKAYSIGKTILATIIIPLLFSGCGKKPEEPPPVAAPQKTTAKAPAPQKAEPKASAPEKVPSNTLKVKRQSKTYVITGIGMGGTNSIAIINNRVITLGMEIDPGVVLKEIHPTYATIAVGNSEYQLRPKSIRNDLGREKN